MRWLYLINALALVILAGAVAIALEGTRFGDRHGPDETLPAEQVQQQSLTEAGPVAAGEEPEPETSPMGVIADGEDARPPELEVDKIAPQETVEPLGVAAPDAPVPVRRPGRTDDIVVSADIPVADPVTEPEPQNPAPEPQLLPEPEPEPDSEPERAAAAPAARTPAADPSEGAPDRPVLTLATEGDYHPFNFLDDTGQPAGFDVELAEALCEQMARECVVRVFAWDDLAGVLLAGEVDAIIASMQISGSHEEGLSFSDPYYGTAGRYLFAGERTGETPVSGEVVHVLRQTSHAAYLRDQRPDLALVEVDTTDDLLDAVRGGEIGFGDNATLMRKIVEADCCLAPGGVVVDRTYFGGGAGIAVRESDGDLREEVNAALAALQANGTYDVISERYFSVSIY